MVSLKVYCDCLVLSCKRCTDDSGKPRDKYVIRVLQPDGDGVLDVSSDYAIKADCTFAKLPLRYISGVSKNGKPFSFFLLLKE